MKRKKAEAEANERSRQRSHEFDLAGLVNDIKKRTDSCVQK